MPVAVGVVVRADRAVLLADRPRGKAYAGYWELPGGKLEPGEAIEDCLVREIDEELNLPVAVGRPLNNWVYFVNGIHVLVITYALQILGDEADMRISHEHKELRSFPLEEIAGLRMPDGYKRSIALHAENARNRANGEPDRPRA